MTTFTVTNDDDSGAGSLRAAIEAANGNSNAGTLDRIEFDIPDGAKIVLTGGELAISQSVVIDGGGNGPGVTIDGNQAGRVFAIEGSGTQATLDSLAMTNGSSREFFGGAIYSGKGTLLNVIDSEVTNSRVTEDIEDQGDASAIGGGIAALGSLNVTDSLIAGNKAAGGIRPGGTGGGIYAAGQLTISDSSILDNAAGSDRYGTGGGISAQGETTIIRSTISDNFTGVAGAGLISDGKLLITDSVFNGNEVDPGGIGVDIGGGIWTDGDTTILRSTISNNGAGGVRANEDFFIANSTVTGNGSSYSSGGLELRGPTSAVVNSTITENGGPLVFGGGIGALDGTVSVANSIVAFNSGFDSGQYASDVVGTIVSKGGNVFSTDPDGAGSGDITNVSKSQLALGTLKDNGGPTPTIALSPSSFAIGAGENEDAVGPDGKALGTDQRGGSFARVSGGEVDAGSYEFAGTVQQPDIAVTGKGQAIADGDTTPRAADGTDFGTVATGGGFASTTFTLSNPGKAALELDEVAITGAGFEIASTPPTTLQPGKSATLKVDFDPGVAGLSKGELRIVSNDPDESPYTFALQGTGLGGNPEIKVSGLNREIKDGDSKPGTADGTDFGSAAVAGGLDQAVFKIANSGNAALSFGNAKLTGANVADFRVVEPFGGSIAPGSSGTLTLSFDPSATGTRKATLSFENNDANENPYSFAVQGKGTGGSPELLFSGKGREIKDNDLSPRTADDTDFGSVKVAGGENENSFTIKNTGKASLQIEDILISGDDVADFDLSGPSTLSLAPGKQAKLAITFDPAEAGLHQAELSFHSNDADEGDFNILLQGTGTGGGRALDMASLDDLVLDGSGVA